MFTMITLFVYLAIFPFASHCGVPTDMGLTNDTVLVNTVKSPPPGCTSFLVVEGNEVKECCLDTGYCKASSCTTLGFKSSSRANCPGPTPCCGLAYCNFTVPTCIPDQGQNEHCFGTVVCNDSSTTCCPDVGAICLEDGNSQNFKICGEAYLSPTPSNGNTGIKEFSPESPSPLPSPACFCAGVDALCQKAEEGWVDMGYTNLVIFPECHNPAFIADAVNEWGIQNDQGGYGCHVDSNNCNLIVCGSFVPSAAFADLPTCPTI